MNHLGRTFLAASAVSLTFVLLQSHAFAAAPAADERTQAPVKLESYLGSYLAGRLARGLNDTENAVLFYRRALENDRTNRRILERAFLMEATEGNAERADRLARRLVKFEKSHRLARLWLGISEFRRGRYAAADEHFKESSDGPIGELTSGLARAWTAAAQGRANSALKLTEAKRRANWAKYYLNYHRALIADVLGRERTAGLTYKQVHAADSRTPRITMAYAHFAARRGDFALAESVLERNARSGGGRMHPSVQAVARDIVEKRRLPRLIGSAQDGLAEVFYGLGEALTTEGGLSLGVIYLQMALHLRPDFEYALAGLANAYESTKQYHRAITTYERIPSASPLRLLVEIRRAKNLDSLDQVDEAKAVLTALLGSANADPAAETEQKTSERLKTLESVKIPETLLKRGMSGTAVEELQKVLAAIGAYSEPVNGRFGQQTRQALRAFQRKAGLPSDGVVGPRTSSSLKAALAAAIDAERARLGLRSARALPLDEDGRMRVYNAIAEMMRRRKRYQESVEYYDRIIAKIDKPSKRHWTFWYARGTSYERLKNWPMAEKDLLKALELNPDQPLILNYLGYSWVDQNKNLERGLRLIARAVQLKPDDGYIVDSLGWAYYRLGRFEEAVEQLERAVELQPSDPILNDHLGDALWRVGRRREARFQWKLALSLKPEKDAVEKIRKKLIAGLPEATNNRSIGLPKQNGEKQKPIGKRASTTLTPLER